MKPTERELKMTTPILCDYCEEGYMATETYSETFKHGRAVLSVEGLKHSRCEACESVMTTAQQFQYNSELIRAAERRAPSYVSPAMLREFREKYGLSQRTAGKLIGAGEGSFGKYESGSGLATPTAKLIRAALAFPEVARMLAEEEDVEISTVSFEDEWKSGRFTYKSTSLLRPTVASQNDDIFNQFTGSPVWQKPNLLTACA